MGQMSNFVSFRFPAVQTDIQAKSKLTSEARTGIATGLSIGYRLTVT